MAERLVIDPVTRIEGHLRIEAQVEGGRVADAYSAGTMVRGLELILPGRDPRDAWALAQRICGVCTTVHALTSVRAVEDALDIRVPANANLIRNIMFATLMVHDHVVHFYHLHAFDWVDVLSALEADPEATSRLAASISSWPRSSPGYFRDLQERLKRFASGGQLGPFANGYWGHPAYRLPPEANLMAVAHYLEALEWQKEIVKIHAVFGGKNPHPNYLVGGVPVSLDPEDPSAVNAERLALVGTLIKQAQEMVEQVYLPDVLAIGRFYAGDLWGGGLGNYLAYGDLPQTDIREPGSYLLPRGVVLGKNLNEVHEVDLKDPEQIQEFVTHSWYAYSRGDDAGLHPWEGETRFNYTGPRPPYEALETSAKYSWLKSPRWKGIPMEVGPLARVVVAYAHGRDDVRQLVDESLGRLGLPPEALFSTLGRTLARALETQLAVRWLQSFYDQLVANVRDGRRVTVNHERWEPSTWPREAQGIGITEAPRGALGHWIHIRDGKIAAYQAVVPTTWNGSPRDAQGQRGAFEAAMMDNPVAVDDQPLEILRTIHSFDPCLACSVHVVDPEGREGVRVQVL
ncbi:nickel-dependent hydrogenase large subunit [Limnochorda pilosa]|uniref:Hydrogenase 2 large subunit n=1 Tax=Limnochorda pilosa TaxID=1555112 RepID=A0A0K2SHA7_LIMPI|nr:nickel-dependent hydrogenase large subunit [Limnochorda pilosa]BAS26506.1 hydrogenase 2 large subunit [Limnochorda pilosa]